MEAQLLKTWPKLMQTDAIIPEERKLIDQWLTTTLKTVEGKWFQYPGKLIFGPLPVSTANDISPYP